ncbi:hypothetical protein [Phyllobacterium calauticae]|jgi:H+/gluconate symporter-like permease|nr:hypothetical protein [Phyllobacterium calauticae]
MKEKLVFYFVLSILTVACLRALARKADWPLRLMARALAAGCAATRRKSV